MDIYWKQENGSEVKIGTSSFAPLNARNARAYINQTNQFAVGDTAAFGAFTQYMITSENFTWILRTSNLAVRAALLPKATGLNFEKTITLPGMDYMRSQLNLY